MLYNKILHVNQLVPNYSNPILNLKFLKHEYYNFSIHSKLIGRYKIEFGFCCGVFLLCLHNTLITTNFNVLKYIKKIFKNQHSIFLILNRDKKINRKSGLVQNYSVIIMVESKYLYNNQVIN